MEILFAVSSPLVLQTGDSDSRKVDSAGRHVRQIELCEPHLNFVIEREHAHGLDVQERRAGR